MTRNNGGGKPRTAGLLDLRWIIAMLMGIFGLVVTVMGLFDDASSTAASGRDVGVNVNLWSGIPMILLAVGFGVWAQVRPTVLPPVDDDTDQPQQEED